MLRDYQGFCDWAEDSKKGKRQGKKNGTKIVLSCFPALQIDQYTINQHFGTETDPQSPKHGALPPKPGVFSSAIQDNPLGTHDLVSN